MFLKGFIFGVVVSTHAAIVNASHNSINALRQQTISEIGRASSPGMRGLRGSNAQNGQDRVLERAKEQRERRMQVSLKKRSCCFDGKCRGPGQWLEGPTHVCMCNRDGIGAWENCQLIKSDEKTIESDGKNTALSHRGQFKDSDFVFDLLGSVPDAITDSGTIQTVTMANLPSLDSQGVSYSLFNIEPCGINLPHTHPRATELLYVINGDNLRTAFVEENGGAAGSRTIVNDLGKGEVTFFPQGLIHYQQNLNCDSVTYISALNSADPGVVTVTTRFFDLPEEAIEGSLGENEKLVDQLISGLPTGPATGRQDCLKKCKEQTR